MQISQTLAEEIRNYVVSLLGHDSRVIGTDGFCFASSSDEEIGTRIKIDTESLSSGSDAMIIKIDGKDNILIPLGFERETVAYLILDQANITEVEKYAPLIKSFAELLIQQYFENNKPLLDSTDQFIIKLVNNASANDLPYYASEAKALGYSLNAKRIAIVVHLDGFWDNCLLSMDQASFERDQIIRNYKRNIENAINGFFSKNTDIIIAYVGDDKFAIFKAVTSEVDEKAIMKFLEKSHKSIFEPLKNARIRSYAIGYSNAYEGIEGLLSGYKEANLSIELGQKLWGLDRSYFFNTLGIMSIIGQGDKEKSKNFSDQLLSKMEDNEDLNETLEAFFDRNLNLTETAEKLGVHRNTIIYRLNQISKILGADPRVFEQAMTIKIALLIKKILV